MDKFAAGICVLLHNGLLNLRRNAADRERGATAVEYSLMVALIAGVIIVSVGVLGGKVIGLFTAASTAIP
jgi:pilus assembly protein Flp/PilA